MTYVNQDDEWNWIARFLEGALSGGWFQNPVRSGLAGDNTASIAQGGQMYSEYRLIGGDYPGREAWLRDVFNRNLDMAISRGGLRKVKKITREQLDPGDAIRTMREYPVGHDRIEDGVDMILLDAAALVAYGSFAGRVVLVEDPFLDVDALADEDGASIDELRCAIFNALVSASEIITIGAAPRLAVYEATGILAENLPLPLAPAFTPDGEWQEKRLLVIVHAGNDARMEGLAAAAAELGGEYQLDVFHIAEHSEGSISAALRLTDAERPISAVIHVGAAQSSQLGARMADAWSSGVPVLQLLPRAARATLRPELDEIVSDRENGLIFADPVDLVGTIRQLASDPAIGRTLTWSARRCIKDRADWLAVARRMVA